MARRKRREPVWPIFLLLGVVAVGLGIGRAVSGPIDADSAATGNLVETGVAAIPTPESRVRVEVLNGGGIQGAAARATELLREAGFDVVYFGNESSFERASSVVLERVRREGASEAAGRTLGITEIRVEPDASRLVDVTVVLGSEWDPDAFVPLMDNVAEAEGRAWWDPRGWVPQELLERGR